MTQSLHTATLDNGITVLGENLPDLESVALAVHVPAGAILVACDERGEAMSSSAFAGRIEKWRDGGAPRLWTVDVTGRIERAAPYPGSGSDPAWSPLLDEQPSNLGSGGPDSCAA